MRTRRLRAWLLDALVAGTAATTACRGSSDVEPENPSTVPPDQATPGSEIAVTPPPVTAADPTAQPTPRQSPPPPVAKYSPPADKTGACVDGQRNVLADLKPSAPADYVELRVRNDNGPGRTLFASGSPCSTAQAPDACHKAFDEPVTKGFGSACRPGMCDHHLIVTDGNGARKLFTKEEVTAFTGPVDTAGEALLTAFVHDYRVLACAGAAPTKVAKGWQVTANLTIEECPVVTADVTLGISEAGAVTVLATKNKKKSNVCVGRRPPDAVEPESGALKAATVQNVVASYLEDSAELELLSVPAFERLEAELEALGAPARLVRLCSKAAEDERRHAKVMTRLALSHGGRAPRATVNGDPRRKALDIALDNAREGCVRETFGAVVGLYQAKTARDGDVRATLGAVAEDEVRHAALAWKLAAWLEPKLSPLERAEVERARETAISELEHELSRDPAEALQSTLGLPSARAALAMTKALGQTLWS